MKATVAKKPLLSALTRIEKASNHKGEMPSLACVHLDATDGRLTLGCTDLYVAATETVDADVHEQGEACIHARALLERVKAMPDGPVILDVGASATVLSGSTTRRFTLPMFASVDMPPVACPPDEDAATVVLASTLVDLLAQVSFSISDDDTRPHLNALKMELGDGVLRFVSTDGHRLTAVELPSEGKAEALIPLRGVQQIARLAAGLKEDDQVAIFVHGGNVSVECHGKTVTVKENDATFPSWREVVPKDDPTTTATVPREACADAVSAVSLSSSERTGGVRFSFTSGTLTLAAESPETGDAVDEVPSDHAGKALEIGFNSSYVLDVLKAFGSDEVVFEMGGDLDPCVIRPVGVEGALSVIMPMRLS